MPAFGAEAFTGEVGLHGIRWRLVDRAGAAGTEALFIRNLPKSAKPAGGGGGGGAKL